MPCKSEISGSYPLENAVRLMIKYFHEGSVERVKLLVAKSNGMTDDEIARFAGLGFEPVMDGDDESVYTGCKSDIGAVICYNFFKHNDIKCFPSLRLIHLTSAGFDHMPIDYMRQAGIRLFNARGVYSVPIAEFVLCGVLQLYKASGLFYRQAAERIWRQDRSLRELSGKKVLILGAGSIAGETGRRFRAMGCHVTALCRHPGENDCFDGQKHVSCLDELLPQSDIVILAAPLNEESFHIFNRERFQNMKDDSVFVNISRGALVDTVAMVEALENKKLYGAVLDVFETEPLESSSPLWQFENVIITPHNSFSGENNGRRTFELIYRDLEKWMKENKTEI